MLSMFFRYIKLGNGLNVLLISDMSIGKSEVEMQVEEEESESDDDDDSESMSNDDSNEYSSDDYEDDDDSQRYCSGKKRSEKQVMNLLLVY